jgi:hypothetical protein
MMWLLNDAPSLQEHLGYQSDTDYKDGTYTVKDRYHVMPGLVKSVRTIVPLEDGVTTDAEVSFAS